MATYHFTVVLQGSGDDADEAWRDAIEGFVNEPGQTPEPHDVTEYTQEADNDKPQSI